jgi:hypothetical protein
MAITKIQSESLNLADTYDFTGTVTGAGESNTPYFTAYNSGNQTGFSSDVITVMAMNTALQNGSEYNTSNYRFTPQTAGKFYLWNVVHVVSLDNTGVTAVCQIRKNGSAIANTYPAISTENMSERFRQCSVSTACVESANGSSDYFDFTFGLVVSSGSNYYLGTGSRTGGFLLKT